MYTSLVQEVRVTLSRAFKATGLLSTPEVARELGVTRSAVWLYIKTGQLKAERVGTWLGVTQADLDDFRAKYPSTVSPATVRASQRKKGAKTPRRRKR